MLLILYIYLLIQIKRSSSRTNANYEKLRRETMQILLDHDRMMREIEGAVKQPKSHMTWPITELPKEFSKAEYTPPIKFGWRFLQPTEAEMLQQCLDEENFELAAVIRDRINKKNAATR